jgi:hypothetical protein
MPAGGKEFIEEARHGAIEFAPTYQIDAVSRIARKSRVRSQRGMTFGGRRRRPW